MVRQNGRREAWGTFVYHRSTPAPGHQITLTVADGEIQVQIHSGISFFMIQGLKQSQTALLVPSKEHLMMEKIPRRVA